MQQWEWLDPEEERDVHGGMMVIVIVLAVLLACAIGLATWMILWLG